MKSKAKGALKRTIGLACAVALTATSLMGCTAASKKEDPNQKPDSASGSNPQLSNNAKFNGTGLPILKEKETYKIAVRQMSPLKAPKDKECAIETEAATNVAVEWMEIPTSAWTEKINIMFSTNSLPDAIIGEVNISRDYTLMAELDALIDAYAPNVQALMNERPEYKSALKAPDGKIHSLPVGDDSYHNQLNLQYWINTEWLKKLNLTMPKTTDEFYKTLVAFRDGDPNGNGQKDEIPFTFRGVWEGNSGIRNILGAFGVVETPAHVFLKDDKVIFASREQGFYDALVWLNKMYKEGLIDKEAFTMSADQYNSRGSGKDIIGVHANYGADNSAVNNGDGSRYQALPVLKGPSGSQLIGANRVVKSGGFSITTECKSPEVLVRWYDYVNSSLELALKWGRGKQGEFWEIVQENGVEKPKFIALNADKLKNMGYSYKTTPEYRNGETFGGSTPSLWRLSYDEKLLYSEDWPKDYKKKAVEEALPFAVYGLPIGNANPQNAERRALLLTDMNNYLMKFVAQAVINGIDEAAWKKHLDSLKTLKVDEYVQLCEEYVKSLK